MEVIIGLTRYGTFDSDKAVQLTKQEVLDAIEDYVANRLKKPELIPLKSAYQMSNDDFVFTIK